jgi:hypothetical protein
MLEGNMKLLLRAEGAALFAGALVTFAALDISWWMFFVLFLAPDLAFVFYLFGPRAGAIAYNTMHSTIGPIVLGAIGWWMGLDILGTILAGCAVIWMAHVGFDRMLGYGLKYASNFHDTHLGKIGRGKS